MNRKEFLKGAGAAVAVAAWEGCASERHVERVDFRRFRLLDAPKCVYCDAQSPLEAGSPCEVAVIFVHGWGGGLERAKGQQSLMRALEKGTGSGRTMPYVIAPLFPRQDRVAKAGLEDEGLATWNASWNVKNLRVRGKADDDWRGGGDAVGTRLSSFDVIDRILDGLSDRARFPNLKRVVMTGFSAGGQFVGRYVAVGKGQVREGIRLEYAAMSPSTELRLDPDVRWHYGLKGRPRYSAGLTEAEIMRNLCSRRVWRGCGTADTLRYPQTSLDSCEEAMAQGPNRYARFRAFEQYLKAYPDWARQVSFHSFEGLGHQGSEAYRDEELLRFVWGQE